MQAAVCSSPCSSRETGSCWELCLQCPCCPLLGVQHLSSPGGKHNSGKKWGSTWAAAPLGWDRARTAWQQGQPGSPATSPRGHGPGLELCCAPVTDQSPTRDKISWEILHQHLWDRKVGSRHPHQLQKSSDHLPPLLDCHGPMGSLPLLSHRVPLCSSTALTTMGTWVSGLKGDLPTHLLLCWWHSGFV